MIDSNQVMQSTWQTSVANASLEFSAEAQFQTFFTKIAVRKHQIFSQFQTEIIKTNTLDSSIKPNDFRKNITLSKH